jgi:UDP-N-acetylmuramate dehydrogenase
MIFKNISLKSYNTFGLNYTAEFLISVKSESELVQILKDKGYVKKPIMILGGGSNLLFTGNFHGTIIRPEIGGMHIDEENSDSVLVSSGAGVNWDSLVEWTVDHGFWGLENLSLIPGTVGASPVQNIGAYGVEVKDLISKVKTICISDGSTRIFSNNECEFGYRSSIFKNKLKGKYLITNVYFNLTNNPSIKPDYGSLNLETEKTGEVTLKNIRQAVINIRKSKLPDPEIIGNAGSFFKNPVVCNSIAGSLKKEYPGLPVYEDPSGGIKLAAGWLIDQCGWKGKRIGDAGVHDKQALVLVNYGKATGKEIFDLSEKIKKSVSEKFSIELEREVEVVGSI